jgi:hypothetical protein
MANLQNCDSYINIPSTQTYTGHTQNNGAVSKVNKSFISHPTRTQHTLSAAGTVQVSRSLPVVRGISFQDGVSAGEDFLCAPF